MTGQIVSHFRILERLGGGGMGVVYLAEDIELDRTVALKFLPAHLTTDQEANARFVHEAKAASALNHPNVCTIHEIGRTDDGQQFIAMAHYPGQTLKERIGQGPVTIDAAVDIVRQIAEGLARAHSHGVVHRDIKPANIILTEDDRAVILDFGLAKLAGAADLTRTGSTLGTVPYMSPEQARGEHLDHRTDIWSVGVILYELLAGRRPFVGEYDQALVYAILNEEPPALTSLKPEVPESLERVVERALHKDPEQRYSDISELAEELTRPSESGATPIRAAASGHRAHGGRSLLKPRVLVPTVLIVALAAAGVTWLVNRQSKIRWAREEALPQLKAALETEWRDFTDAYEIALAAEKIIPRDPELAEIFNAISLRMSIHTTPPGAEVSVKRYQSPDADWRYLGVTPLDSIRMPIGIFRWQMTKGGYDTVHAVASSWDIHLGGDELLSPYVLERTLDTSDSIPHGMVRVPGAQTPSGAVTDFYIDRTEVTNRQFKEFVDADGYETPEYWTEDFELDGRSLSWEEAMARFEDQTGRPGPSNWQAGTYADDEGDHPVTGVSWYEASAYAEYAGKRLPTSVHWGLARGERTPIISFFQLGGFAVYAPFSNFGADGTVPAGSLAGITAYGAVDMAGNAREWNANRSPGGRIVRGGAWGDNTYMFGKVSQAPPFDRSERNGFRCVLYSEGDEVAAAPQFVTFPENPDFYAMEPVSDEIFELYRERLRYDEAPLNADLQRRSEEHPDYVYERVAFDAAYRGERVIGHLFLPKNSSPPYQTVVYFPGSAALLQPSSEDMEHYYEYPIFLSFLVKNGRAVFFPVYAGTFERGRADLPQLLAGGQQKTRLHSDWIIDVIRDFSRSVDYLESREDIDTDRIAYYGMSFGGWLGAIIPAVETRIATAVVAFGGLRDEGRPEVHPINYVGRVSMPVLMLNGRYDSAFLVDTSILPMYDLLGTPEEHKQLKLFASDHIIPKNDLIRETLDWLDRYLGPVD
jgi:dienelactone hydrolase/predicted Ser/Thr protein kinase